MKKKAKIWFSALSHGWGIYIEESYNWGKAEKSLFIKQIYGTANTEEHARQVVKEQIRTWMDLHHFKMADVVVRDASNLKLRDRNAKLARELAKTAEGMTENAKVE